MNLIMNGIEAMRGVTERAQGADGVLELSPMPDSVLVSVEDTGMGFDPCRRATPLRTLLHDKIRRPRHGTFDLSIDRRRPSRPLVGVAARPAWRRRPLHRPYRAGAVASRRGALAGSCSWRIAPPPNRRRRLPKAPPQATSPRLVTLASRGLKPARDRGPAFAFLAGRKSVAISFVNIRTNANYVVVEAKPSSLVPLWGRG